MSRAALAALAIVALAGCSTLPFAKEPALPLTADAARAARTTDTAAHRAVPFDQARALARNGHVFVTYGQSNATNSGAPGYRVSGPVFMVFEGRAYPYADPTLGGTGPGGSVWGRLGDRLVANGAGSAFFATAGFGATTMQQLAAPPHVDHLVAELRATRAALGRIDAVLIHQGESNHRDLRGARDYPRAFADLLAKIRAETDAPVYLSLATICGNDSDPKLIALQSELIRTTPGVLRGPNTDQLASPEDRMPDGCHFSAQGLDRFAAQWVEALAAESEE